MEKNRYKGKVSKFLRFRSDHWKAATRLWPVLEEPLQGFEDRLNFLVMELYQLNFLFHIVTFLALCCHHVFIILILIYLLSIAQFLRRFRFLVKTKQHDHQSWEFLNLFYTIKKKNTILQSILFKWLIFFVKIWNLSIVLFEHLHPIISRLDHKFVQDTDLTFYSCQNSCQFFRLFWISFPC